MSVEILKALMRLFAIVAKQDDGASSFTRNFVVQFLEEQLNEKSVEEYISLFDDYLEQENGGDISESEGVKKSKLESVRDSVKMMGVCRKINDTLTIKQKIVVVVRLFELINTDRKFTPDRMAIINMVAKVFNVDKDEYASIEHFVKIEKLVDGDLSDNVLLIDKSLFVLHIPSVNLYFLKYTDVGEVFLNGLQTNNNRIYLIARGSIIKFLKGKPLFYSDIVSAFLKDDDLIHFLMEANNVSYRFVNGDIGLRNISLSESSGKLLGIMGASGSGKTTLLNVLSGIEKPCEGDVLINDINIHEADKQIKGIIGYVPQDDLLFEELTVYENLFYSAQLIYKGWTIESIKERVLKVISDLNLLKIKDLKVGSPLNKKISGGQRKRLNIGLELLREPAVLFVDEPTSGLSSRGSENIMELLRGMTLKGKLVVTVIHQPSSDVYKMFDKIVILDEGGYQIYYGNPVEAIRYFKEVEKQINSSDADCRLCGNVNPESIFNIIDSKIVDELGNTTDLRKVVPSQWCNIFNEHEISNIDEIVEKEKNKYNQLPDSVNVPSRFQQFKVFFQRDVLSKIADKQYLFINLLIAPVLACILAFILRYVHDPHLDVYIFRENINMLPYVFMCTIIAGFIGLMVSAEEIFKDRKILKRETLLNLSRNSYLLAKSSLLVLMSAIQAALFVAVGNSIMGINGMYFDYWLVFFSMSVLSNIMGLNISSSFNSAVTIYIIIPFLLIPQMLLAGAMFSFDTINRSIGGGGEKVPVIAEMIPSRWAFEALIVNQYVNNDYAKVFYELEKIEANYNKKNAYYLPELKKIIDKYKINKAFHPEEAAISSDDLLLLRNEISKEQQLINTISFNQMDDLVPGSFTGATADSVTSYFSQLSSYYKRKYNSVNRKRDAIVRKMTASKDDKEAFDNLYDSYFNQKISDYVKNIYTFSPYVRINNELIQKINPIYLDSENDYGIGIRSHFLAPKKFFLGKSFSTFNINILLLWAFIIVLYIALYYNVLSKTLLAMKRINFKRNVIT